VFRRQFLERRNHPLLFVVLSGSKESTCPSVNTRPRGDVLSAVATPFLVRYRNRLRRLIGAAVGLCFGSWSSLPRYSCPRHHTPCHLKYHFFPQTSRHASDVTSGQSQTSNTGVTSDKGSASERGIRQRTKETKKKGYCKSCTGRPGDWRLVYVSKHDSDPLRSSTAVRYVSYVSSTAGLSNALKLPLCSRIPKGRSQLSCGPKQNDEAGGGAKTNLNCAPQEMRADTGNMTHWSSFFLRPRLRSGDAAILFRTRDVTLRAAVFHKGGNGSGQKDFLDFLAGTGRAKLLLINKPLAFRATMAERWPPQSPAVGRRRLPI